MKVQKSKNHRHTKEKQIAAVQSVVNDQRLHTAMSRLMEKPEDWENAVVNPSAWLSAQGLELPEGLDVFLTRDVSFSTPLGPGSSELPGPDWNPYEFKLTNCRTYVVATRDKDGKITGYHLETVCFGFEIVMNPFPGPFPGPFGLRSTGAGRLATNQAGEDGE